MQTRLITLLREVPGQTALAVSPYASVAVYQPGGSFTTLAPGVVDGAGNPVNPLTSDVNGQVRIGALDGLYDLRITHTDGVTRDLVNEPWADQLTAAAEAKAARDLVVPLVATATAARDGSVSAQALAETARDGAVAAKVLAEVARDGAQAAAFFQTNRASVVVATNGPLPANTANVGAGTLTMNAAGVLVVEGVSNPATVIVKDEADQTKNGFYSLTTPGVAGTTAAVLTRRSTENTGASLANACAQVQSGTVNAGWTFVVQQSSITLGATPVTFSGQPTAIAAEAIARLAGDNARSGALLISTYPGLGRLAIVDSQMNLLGYFSPSGLDFSDINSLKSAVAILQGVAATLPGFDSPPGSGALVARDSAGNLGWQITPAQVDHPDTNAMRAAVTDLLASDAYKAISPAGGVMHVITLNQSLGLGTSSGPVLTPAPVPGGLIFANALRILDALSEDQADWGSLAPLYERSSPFDASLRETHSSGMVQRINERLIADYGVNLTGLNQSVLTTIIGSGGISVQELLQTPYKERLTNTIIKGASESQLSGKSYNPLAVVLVQGEANQATPAETFYSLHKQLYDNAVAQANISRGGNRPLAWITYQTSSYPQGGWVAPFAAEAYLYIQERNQFGVMACPIYPFAYADGLHLLASGYKTMGAYFGDALYELLFRRYRRPLLRPTIERLNSKTLGLRYKLRPGARLVFDQSITTRDGVTLAQKGIRVGKVDDLAFAMPTEIAGSVNVVGPDCIEFAAATSIPNDGSYEVKTGWYGSTSRNYTELRDNSGDLIPAFDPSGLNVKLHTWFPISRTTIYV